MIPTVKLVKQLMEFQTVSEDIQNINKCVDFLKQYLETNGVYTRLEKLKTRKILYAAVRKTKTPAILFNAHLDVVPAADKMFRLKKQNGCIYGRGTADCLGNCAVLAQVLIQCRDRSDVGVIFSTDEEIGGNTTRAMIHKGYRGDIIIIMDSVRDRCDITTAQKGVLTLKLTASGKSCHGSSPWLGKNAIDRLIKGYIKIKTLFPQIKRGDEWHTSLSANMISAGTVFNRVPDHAEMILDIRYTETTSPRDLIGKIRKISGLKIDIEADYPVFCCDEHGIVLQELRSFMAKNLRRRINLIRMNGATDARHFVNLKVPVAMIGIPGKGHHADEERVNIKQMLNYQAMLVRLCMQSLNSLGKK